MKRCVGLIIFTALISTVSFAQNRTNNQPQVPEGFKIVKNVFYAGNSNQAQTLDVLIPEDKKLGKLPALVFVHGGGCSGLSYGMTYAEEKLDTDAQLGNEECNILVDPVALGYLQGCEIDYRDGPTGASFIFNNVFKSVGG